MTNRYSPAGRFVFQGKKPRTQLPFSLMNGEIRRGC